MLDLWTFLPATILILFKCRNVSSSSSCSGHRGSHARSCSTTHLERCSARRCQVPLVLCASMLMLKLMRHNSPGEKRDVKHVVFRFLLITCSSPTLIHPHSGHPTLTQLLIIPVGKRTLQGLIIIPGRKRRHP